MTPKKLAVLRVAKSQLALEDDSYRAILSVQGGVESATELDDAGFDRVMTRLRELGFVSTARGKWFKSAEQDPEAVITPGQQKRLETLFGGLEWPLARQQGFSQRMCKKAWPQTRAEANRVIEALKAMTARGYKGPKGA